MEEETQLFPGVPCFVDGDPEASGFLRTAVTGWLPASQIRSELPLPGRGGGGRCRFGLSPAIGTRVRT
jgi:hypothetical protein